MIKDAEKKFWQDALQSCYPTWKVELGRHFDAAQGASKNDVAVYFVDTSTGFIASGCLRSSDFISLSDKFRKMAQSSTEGAAAIGDAILSGVLYNSEDRNERIEDVVLSAAGCLALSQTYGAVKQQTGGVSGQWLYLGYLLKDGARMGRPFFMKPADRDSGLMDMADVVALARQAIYADIANTGGNVGGLIKRSGGLVLDAAFTKPAMQ